MSTFLNSPKCNRLRGDGDEHFRINLCRRYCSAVAPLRLLLMGVCAMLASAILWNLAQMMVTHQECRTIEAELDRVRQQDLHLLAEARREGVDLSEHALSRLSFEVELANQLIEKRAFSWTKFLAELEQAVPPRLALSSVRLDHARTAIRLTGTAMSVEDITAFTVGLQNHAAFTDPVVAQHHAGSNGLVEFDVTAQYRRDGV